MDGSFKQGARKGNTLLLTAGESDTAFADDGIIAFGHSLDEMVGIRHDSSLRDISSNAAVRTAVCNIPFNCIRKKKDILHCHADVVTQIVKVPRPWTFTPSTRTSPEVASTETAQQVHDGGFAGTGGTDECRLSVLFFTVKLISFTISSSSALYRKHSLNSTFPSICLRGYTGTGGIFTQRLFHYRYV